LDQAIIERARAAAAERGCSNISFGEGSIYELPFPNGSFDAVLAHAVLNHLGGPVEALKEMYRVLKPEGVIGVRVTSPDEFLREPSDPIMERCANLVERIYRHNGGDRSIGQRFRPLLREAGFARIRVSASYECYRTVEEAKMWAERMAGGFTRPPMSEQLMELGWASQAELDEIAAFWRAWGENPDAFLARTWREAVS
jgi:ubiquinone/menaquinone biosynthesis C-methylase UbiE